MIDEDSSMSELDKMENEYVPPESEANLTPRRDKDLNACQPVEGEIVNSQKEENGKL
eukprot:CAMPEP_0168335354 /NCGR_PEP_ID=MMETSP0213-20121227/10860_1 /TAXON_ID=151035 /ORGANISM="Euplotes harpa, Strain FSP1.4" /LENGTH=56 /DNA_ID=CAMNT_0008340267 /DNA_START=205 /DNA_END=375 /DNA_ORIENTATION=-